jgi:hypothetical protein
MKVDNNEQRSTSSGLSNENIKMENQNVEDKDEFSFECIDTSSDEESGLTPHRYSLRDRKANKSLNLNDQMSQSTSEVEDYIDEISKEGSHEYQWTENDSIRLIFILNKVGKQWTMIADEYKNYLKNKSSIYLCSKYYHLKKHETLFQNLSEKSKLVKDVQIGKISYSRKPSVRWSDKEFAFLIYGVMKHGTRWDLTLDLFNQYFSRDAKLMDIKNAYQRLRKHPERLIYFQKKAKLFIQNTK